jgi:predicted Fe-Mo cluster-binding NifX family protein
MKIVVTSLGESPESPIDQRFGRARFLLLHDLDSGKWSTHDNRQSIEASQGAGVQAAQHVVELGAQVVITGHCGPTAFAALAAAGIDVYQEASGSVQEALAAYKSGALKKSDHADVDAGFGSV